MTALHVWDLDGTLLSGEPLISPRTLHSASLEISRRLECDWLVYGMELRLARGELTHAQFARSTYGLWRRMVPALTPALIAEIAAEAPWLHGIAQMTADVRARGEHSMVVSMSPGFFVEQLLRPQWGLELAVGQPFPPLPWDGAPYDEGAAYSPADKVRLVEQVRGELGIAPSRVVPYGDGASCVPLHTALRGRGVAVNACTQIRDLAGPEGWYDGPSIWEAYQVGRRRLDSSPGSPAVMPLWERQGERGCA